MSERFPGGFITKTPPVPTLASASGVWTVEQAMEYQKAGTWPYAGPTYIEDVFSSYLYTGNGTTQTITNGVDLSNYGGLVWAKDRDSANGHTLYDTARGVSKRLVTNTTAAQITEATNEGVYAFGTTGFSLGGASAQSNGSGNKEVSWTFRKQPKFFDIVTFVAGSSTNRTISHSLGSTPAFYVMKDVSGVSQWPAYHTSLGANQYVALNKTDATTTSTGVWGTGPTSTTFSVDESGLCTSGNTYVVYLFASNAGGFGLTGTDNVISCGSFTTDGSGNATVSLGYEPQWLLIKKTSATGPWYLEDNMRNFARAVVNYLNPNSSGIDTEVTAENALYPTATGFGGTSAFLDLSSTYIYIAIRRGPMKVPTTGTSVFLPYTAAVATGGVNVSTGFVADLTISHENRAGTGSATYVTDRLRGSSASRQGTMLTSSIGAEATTASGAYYDYAYNTSLYDKFAASNSFAAGNFVDWIFRRAPSFMDVVCYTGTGANTTFSHNLQAVPELMIVKVRAGTTNNWLIYSSTIGAGNVMQLNTTIASTASSAVWNSTAPTSTVFSVGTNTAVNGSGNTYVAYLFATCAGVSKVGSYTGNGSSQTINCGFTGGARFILIKRTDSTGDWYVWDTARGIVAGNDPHLSLNTTAAEVTTDDTIDPDNSGFIVNQLAATNVNVTSATYIFLAIA